MKIDKILVATDFSAPSFKAVEYGIELAKTFEGQLHLLHVTQPPVGAHPVFGGYSPSPEELSAKAEAFLEAAVDSETATAVELVREHRFGEAEVEIPRYADEIDASLIVVGTHRYGPLNQALFGGVAANTMQKSSCPVLTVHADEEGFISPESENNDGH